MSIFSSSKKSSDLNADEFKSKMDQDQNAVLLDVRTPEEVAEGSIADSQHLDFFSSDFKDRIKTLPKDKNYFVYCRSGNRSGKAVNLLTSEGYTAYNLEGGIMNWPY